MRSIATSASAGLVSHDGDLLSHSFGPRLPNSNTNSSKPA
jgi:hypothetical protein